MDPQEIGQIPIGSHEITRNIEKQLVLFDIDSEIKSTGGASKLIRPLNNFRMEIEPLSKIVEEMRKRNLVEF
jgi:hypothetical protein